jgi:hypothetical protein
MMSEQSILRHTMQRKAIDIARLLMSLPPDTQIQVSMQYDNGVEIAGVPPKPGDMLNLQCWLRAPFTPDMFTATPMADRAARSAFSLGQKILADGERELQPMQKSIWPHKAFALMDKRGSLNYQLAEVRGYMLALFVAITQSLGLDRLVRFIVRHIKRGDS